MSTHFKAAGDYKCAKGAAADLKIAAESVFVAEHDAGRERVGNRLELAKLGMSEIGTGFGESFPLPRDLNHSDHVLSQHDRRAHDFLDRIAAHFVGDRHGFENGGVRHHCEVIHQLGPLFANRTSRKRIRARERNLADDAKAIGREESQRALVGCQSENGDLMRLHAEILADQIDGAVKTNGLPIAFGTSEVVRPLLNLADVIAGHPRAGKADQLPLRCYDEFCIGAL